MLDNIPSEKVMKICRLCGFFKDNQCKITKKTKDGEDECDVDIGQTRKAFMYRDQMITK